MWHRRLGYVRDGERAFSFQRSRATGGIEADNIVFGLEAGGILSRALISLGIAEVVIGGQGMGGSSVRHFAIARWAGPAERPSGCHTMTRV